MLVDIMTIAGDAGAAFVGVLKSTLDAVVPLFYDSTITTGSKVTFLGTLLLIAVGVGVVYMIFNLIKGLVARQR